MWKKDEKLPFAERLEPFGFESLGDLHPKADRSISISRVRFMRLYLAEMVFTNSVTRRTVFFKSFMCAIEAGPWIYRHGTATVPLGTPAFVR